MPDQLGLSTADGVKATEAKSETWQELATSQEVCALQHLCDDASVSTVRMHLVHNVTYSISGPTSSDI